MKRETILIMVGVLIMLTPSCEDKRLQTYTANVPVYMSYEDLRKAVAPEGPRVIEQPGKIYFKDTYIYINEYMEGVHVVDISDPSNPTAVAYIPVPGNIDMAIKDDILYLDSYIDLVLVDISDPEQPEIVNRLEDMLEYTTPDFDPDYPVARVDRDKGVVTGWEVKEHTEEIYYNPYPWPLYMSYAEIDMLSSSSVRGAGAPSGSGYGVGGSMARFLTYDDYLYLLETDYTLKVIDISNTAEPVEKYDKYIGWGLETMFIYDQYMYLGAQNGLYILSLENPANPYYTSMYSHITSCDPVVVEGNRAYVTLRAGTLCGGNDNLLEVVDVSNKWEPVRIATYPLTEPYGLGISGSTLFVCQGDYGLNVYDASDPYTITSNEIASFDAIKATDVIPLDTLLFTIGDSGFYIYNISDVQNIVQVGQIDIE
jgi:hypothetical protein